MSSTKRDFTDFDKFPGKLNKKTQIYEFPPLYHLDGDNRHRIWSVFVRLVKDNNPQSGIDWSLDEETQVVIKDEYFSIEGDYTDLPKGVVTQVWVETGLIDGKITRNNPTYISKVANKGKKNQRNLFQQGLIKARTLYLKKVDDGCTTSKSAVKKISGTNIMYYPMLADTWKKSSKYITYPAFIQPKLDGVRCLAYLYKKNGGAESVKFYSRKLHEYDMKYLAEALYEVLNDLYDEKKDQSIYLDGELYKHGKLLQDITGESRNIKKRPTKEAESDDDEDTTDSESNTNEYHVYDCFYPLEMDVAYESRKEQLDSIFEVILDDQTSDLYKYVKPVPTFEVKNETAANKQYNKFLTLSYEGGIIRNKLGPYLGNATRTGSFLRSKDLIKMKPKFTDEFKVINYTQGDNGKDKGAVLWVCQTTNEVQFNVTPKDMTYEERYAKFKECEKSFDKKYKDRMLTVEYEDLSKDGVPLRAKALVFRDYE
jgi:ATP-dependent DNA ligase